MLLLLFIVLSFCVCEEEIKGLKAFVFLFPILFVEVFFVCVCSCSVKIAFKYFWSSFQSVEVTITKNKHEKKKTYTKSKSTNDVRCELYMPNFTVYRSITLHIVQENATAIPKMANQMALIVYTVLWCFPSLPLQFELGIRFVSKKVCVATHTKIKNFAVWVWLCI